jgi:hypothetical protein
MFAYEIGLAKRHPRRLPIRRPWNDRLSRRFLRLPTGRAYPYRPVPARLIEPQSGDARGWYLGRPVCVHVRRWMGRSHPIQSLKKALSWEGAPRG